jgi:hypothetical protein
VPFARSADHVSQTPQSSPEILPIRGELYRLQMGDRATVFLVTPAGIILADPIGPAAARWLEARSMYPKLPDGS